MPRVDIQPPAPDQVAILIRMAAEEEPEFAVFLRLAAATGARRGELCALRWSDVDLDAGTVIVARSIVRGGDGLVEKETKTHAIRRIALDRGTVIDVGDHLHRSHELAGQFGVDFSESGYVFSYQPDRSAPWRPDVATARFERLRDRAGLPTVRLHDLRHYVATRLIGAGVSVRTVSGRLGHANPAKTLSVYSHFLQAADQQAAQCWATSSTDRWMIPTTAGESKVGHDHRIADRRGLTRAHRQLIIERKVRAAMKERVAALA